MSNQRLALAWVLMVVILAVELVGDTEDTLLSLVITALIFAPIVWLRWRRRHNA